MLKNYLIMTVRHVKKQMIYFTINIIGLGIGLGACFLLLLYAINEFTYDSYQPEADQTYRILRFDLEKKQYDGKTPYPFAGLIRQQIPSVETVSQLYRHEFKFQYANEELSNEHYWSFTDSDFFKIFDVPLSTGPIDEWADPFQIYISEKLAAYYFPDKNPVGETISIDENNVKKTLKITGTFKSLPSNTHLNMDVIAPLSLALQLYKDQEFMGFKWAAFESWDRDILHTYVHLKKGTNIKNVAEQLKLVAQNHLENPENVDYSLQPLKAIHLHSAHINNNGGPHGNLQQTLLLMAIAVLILVVAVFNFILLSTAQSNTRLREIGVRKVLGAQKNHILRQTLSESTMTAVASLPVALFFVEVLLPVFNHLVQKNLVLLDWKNWLFALCAIGLTALVGLFSGVYTAFYFARVQPNQILKIAASPFNSKSILRRLLISAQFVIFIGLLISTMIIFKQFFYIQHKHLGYDREHLLTIPLTSKQTVAAYPAFKTQLKSSPYIINVSGASYTPPTESFLWAKLGKDGKGVEFIFIDSDYFETMDIRVKDGSVFSDSNPSEQNGIVLTASAVPYLELEQPLGTNPFGIGPITGIVEDFHIRSLHRDIRPVLFKFDNSKISTAVVRIHPNAVPEALRDIKGIWRDVYPNTPFSCQFVDLALEQAYRADVRFGRLIRLFTFLAIFIASMGIFGLSLFMTLQKTKEIGTRKILGASVPGIWKMLTIDFTKWILVANVIAWPVTWYAMNKWLQNFAYKIDLTVWPFLLAGLSALAICLLTVSWQTIKAATADPAEALRYE
ncbi:ABC transporter permease [candidate division KSB1 bacterium]|nr:ABC transporter permease [candidate division KSB1 bacterium]